jgi:hypothetical protein
MARQRLNAAWRAAMAALLALTAASQQPPGGKQEPPKSLPEYELKAAFLFQFVKYMQWPQEAFDRETSPVIVGIVGEDPFGEALARTLRDKTVKGRGFEIRRFAKPQDVRDCHLLFVPRTESTRWPEIHKALANRAVLTIGEDVEFARRGGMVGILIVDEKPKLEVNPDAARQAKLVVEAKLLKAATIVRTER